MAGSSVILSPRAIEALDALAPPLQTAAKEVLDLLGNTEWRNQHKCSLNIHDPFTGSLIQSVHVERIFIEFIEKDGSVEVAHITAISLFRPIARSWRTAKMGIDNQKEDYGCG